MAIAHFAIAHFYEAKVKHVEDADVFHADIDLGFGVHYLVRLRLHGLTCTANRSEGSDLGDAIFNFVYDWLTARDSVYVLSVFDEDMNSYTALVYSDPEMTACLNEDLVDNGYAFPIG